MIQKGRKVILNKWLNSFCGTWKNCLIRPSINSFLFAVTRPTPGISAVSKNFGSIKLISLAIFFICVRACWWQTGYKTTPSAIVLSTFTYSLKLTEQVAWSMDFLVVHFIDFRHGLTFVDKKIKYLRIIFSLMVFKRNYTM